MVEIHVGISGWTYPPWRGDFYPPGLPHKRELSYAASRLGSIEVNGTFYGLLRPTSFTNWVSEVPTDFVFAVKGSRFITHLKKLSDVRTPLANFFASGVLALEEHLAAAVAAATQSRLRLRATRCVLRVAAPDPRRGGRARS